ncbi:SseB family protein [Actinoplanes sp. Pm04-4]|uniref:SseB family protein n=1 Tax=Paractinoplanes pyxinae TaxID=2997416 RepID=A0ABT4AT31_9ACTN|nr:SseB family protein [Actinoplanes pyxinae]MCY1137389.1 SseB family protein [Actinoplanes pyxinae]
MSEWEPATDAEVAMRDALRTDDQESYFRILSGVDLLLPVSADALAGLAPLGWGTWSTGGRTHVLAFTSTAALQSCLADYTGSARRVPYAELANTWPNLEWWLAVNPGLPIEGYLPAWFVAQLSRGDLRLPTRGPGRAESKTGNNKLQDLQAAAMAANAAAVNQEEAGRPGGPTHEDTPLTAATGSYPQYPSGTYGQPAPAAYGRPASAAPAGYGQPSQPPATSVPAAYGQPSQPPAPASPAPGPYGQPSVPVAPGYGQPAQPSAPVAPGYSQPAAPAAYGQAAANTYGGAYAQQAGQPPSDTLPERAPAGDNSPAATGGLPTRMPSSPDGLPARTPSGPDALPSRSPSGPGGLPTRTPSAADALPTRTPSAADALPTRTPSATDALPARTPSIADALPSRSPSGPGGLPTRTPSAADALPPRTPSATDALPTRTPSAFGQPAANAQASAPPASAPPATDRPASAPPATYGRPAGAPPAYGQPASSPAAYGQPASAPPAYGQPSGGQPNSAPPAYGRPASAPPAYGQPTSPAAPAQSPAPSGPGGLPVRTPGSVMPNGVPNGLPVRTPGATPSSGPASPVAPTTPPAYQQPTLPTAYQQPTSPAAVPPAYQPPPVPPVSSAPPMSARPPAGPGDDPRGALQNPSGPLPVRTPMAQTPPVPEHITPHNPEETPFNPNWSGTSGAPSGALGDLPRRQPTEGALGDVPRRQPTEGAMGDAPGREGRMGDLPRRQPTDGGMGDAPRQPTEGRMGDLPRRQPIEGAPGDLPRREPTEGRPAGFPQGPASPQAAAAQRTPPAMMPPISAPPAPASPSPAMPAEPSPGFGTPLPRRQATPPSERPGLTSFPAFQTRSDAPQQPVAPPVIPGSPGSDRPARLGAQAAFEPAPPAENRAESRAESFVPANDVERDLFEAAGGHSTDAYLSTLLLATVLVPVANHSRPGSSPGESGFAFRTEQVDGETFLIVFTSKDRLAEHYSEPTRTVGVRFYELIRNWPDPAWSFAVNPDGPIGAKYPGPQVIALASWAAESGLGGDQDGPLEDADPVPAPEPASDDAQHATVMQKTLPPEQVDYYLERGYDRVAGFVHRATEVEHLRTPAELLGALGLSYDGSPHQTDAKEAYVLRWPAYRPSLYRIPYGGQNEQALRAMDGWVIERAPFRGNGFAPGEGRDVIAEFKVDSVRLPHGAQLWRIDADGAERMVAIFDNDGPIWRRVGEQ